MFWVLEATLVVFAFVSLPIAVFVIAQMKAYTGCVAVIVVAEVAKFVAVVVFVVVVVATECSAVLVELWVRLLSSVGAWQQEPIVTEKLVAVDW